MTTTTHRHRGTIDRPAGAEADAASDDVGATLAELLVVIVILVLLASSVVFAVSGMRADAAGSRCAADRHALANAVETYFAQYDADAIDATGSGHDRHERTLVELRLLRGVSVYHDLDADGVITAEGGISC